MLVEGQVVVGNGCRGQVAEGKMRWGGGKQGWARCGGTGVLGGG